MPVTDQDARALTYLACRIRKETHGAREWDENGTYAVIKRFVGHNLALTVERVTRHAADPEARTPAAMERPFVPDAPHAGPARPPKCEEACELHGGHKDRCPGCAADRLTGDAATRPAPVRTGPTPEYLQARAASRAAHPTHTDTESE